jgi:hypothetical protein
MEDLDTKYKHLKIDCERREQILINSLTLYDNKILDLKSRLENITMLIKYQDETIDEKVRKVKQELKKDISYT